MLRKYNIQLIGIKSVFYDKQNSTIEVIDREEIIERLKPIIFKSRYQTHHVFAEGDLLMTDQFTTLHRRTPVMGDRLLWRVASDYSKV